jgi:tRNA(Arg) A34 adenosine deaminase TadA
VLSSGVFGHTFIQSIIMSMVLDFSNPLPKLTATADELETLLGCIEKDIVPLTQKGVQGGNKVFGAAILDSTHLQKTTTLLAETNAELESPLFHGEVHLIYKWSKVTPPCRTWHFSSTEYLCVHT